jgi:hypothetical protein
MIRGFYSLPWAARMVGEGRSPGSGVGARPGRAEDDDPTTQGDRPDRGLALAKKPPRTPHPHSHDTAGGLAGP